VDLEDYH
jgi:antitoxin HigA-1